MAAEETRSVGAFLRAHGSWIAVGVLAAIVVMLLPGALILPSHRSDSYNEARTLGQWLALMAEVIALYSIPALAVGFGLAFAAVVLPARSIVRSRQRRGLSASGGLEKAAWAIAAAVACASGGAGTLIGVLMFAGG